MSATGGTYGQVKAHLNWTVILTRCIALGATTQRTRARLLGVNRTTLWRWRAGRSDISITCAQSLAQRIGLDLNDILLSKPPPPPPRDPKPEAPRRPPAGPGDPRPPAGPRRADR